MATPRLFRCPGGAPTPARLAAPKSFGAAVAFLFAVVALAASSAAAQELYFPGPGEDWERRSPEQLGMNPALVQQAVQAAIEAETRGTRDLLARHQTSFGREPHGEAIGPFRDRGDASGVIIHRGYLVAEWGDPDRVDVTYSVTKSFVTTTVGLAYDRGMIRDLNHQVRDYFAPVVAVAADATSVQEPGAQPPRGGVVILPFESEHNRKITWDHLLRQTSDWQGTLWGKPDWADRPRGNLQEWQNRERFEPGTRYMYNDVRVNLLALASLNIWRRPLPEVLQEYVMDPIGASNTWRWHGYDNSWVILDGQLVQSVSGGAHWGGGMWISARDLGRFGLLNARGGRWGDRQLLSREWLEMASTPGVSQGYGFMNYFLNRGQRSLSAAPETAVVHRGAGSNLVYVDPENDLVIVTRWINGGALSGIVRRVIESLPSAPAAGGGR